MFAALPLLALAVCAGLVTAICAMQLISDPAESNRLVRARVGFDVKARARLLCRRMTRHRVPQPGRMFLIIGSAVVVSAVLLLTAIATVLILVQPKYSASVADVVAIGALLVLAIAAGVAIATYAVSTRKPVLSPKLTLPGFPGGELIFVAAERVGPDRGAAVELDPTREPVVRVQITNTSGNTAKDVALRITLVGVIGLKAQPGWDALEESRAGGIHVLQWDGGGNQNVHGNWTRQLPSLDLTTARFVQREKHELIIEVVCEGYRPLKPTCRLLEVVSDKEWTERAVAAKRPKRPA